MTLQAAPAPAPTAARIFNHDVMSCTADGVAGNHLYSGRVLGTTEPADRIQLHPELKPEWPHICAHYERIGLSHTRDTVWHVDPAGLAEHPEHAISVFYFGAAEHAARPDPDWYRVVDYINSKNRFMALADRLGVPVPRTQCFADAPAVAVADPAELPFPCWVKAAVSVSGVGIYRCDGPADLASILARFAPGVPLQVQAEVATDRFLNLQYEVSEAGCTPLAVTEQILEGPAHQGNRCPACASPWEIVEPMARWLYREGMRGVFAFDVAVCEGPDGLSFLAIECNPRFNGASYPTAVARKLAIPAWSARTYKTARASLADLDLAGLEYDPATGHGVILVNWGTILVGKLLVMLAGPADVQAELERELCARL